MTSNAEFVRKVFPVNPAYKSGRLGFYGYEVGPFFINVYHEEMKPQDNERELFTLTHTRTGLALVQRESREVCERLAHRLQEFNCWDVDSGNEIPKETQHLVREIIADVLEDE